MKDREKQYFDNILNIIDEKDLKGFIVDMLIYDTEFYEKFRREFINAFPTLSKEQYKEKIKSAIKKCGGKDGYIDYEESLEYTHAMYGFLVECKKLIDGEDYEPAFDIVTAILDSIPDTDIDNSRNSTEKVAKQCIEIIESILSQNLDYMNKKILEYLLKEVKTGYLANYRVELHELLNFYIEKGLYIEKIEETLLSSLKEIKYAWLKKSYINVLNKIYNVTGNTDKMAVINDIYC